LLHEIEPKRRILRGPAAADIHRSERTHCFGIVGLGLRFECRRNLLLVDIDRYPVADAIGDVARGIGERIVR
jgi:hypothetical protein